MPEYGKWSYSVLVYLREFKDHPLIAHDFDTEQTATALAVYLWNSDKLGAHIDRIDLHGIMKPSKYGAWKQRGETLYKIVT